MAEVRIDNLDGVTLYCVKLRQLPAAIEHSGLQFQLLEALSPSVFDQTDVGLLLDELQRLYAVASTPVRREIGDVTLALTAVEAPCRIVLNPY
ncbi:hypothetical protein ABGN05_08565 [Aquibium sp. LZ166]|uniref:Uncharacterized protein n=1 Tax=Aquibium pacificus TaxID=3153579 RepID=A0ABV3SGP4_9HYPH